MSLKILVALQLREHAKTIKQVRGKLLGNELLASFYLVKDSVLLEN